MIVDLPSFWILIFATFSSGGGATIEITTSVFDRNTRYERHEKCESAYIKQVTYWDNNPIEFT